MWSTFRIVPILKSRDPSSPTNHGTLTISHLCYASILDQDIADGQGKRGYTPELREGSGGDSLPWITSLLLELSWRRAEYM